MGNQTNNKEIAAIYLKTALGHFDNRCDNCGRRLKFKPGGFITFTGRFNTCRSCGYENPTLLEKVDEQLREAGFPGIVEDEGVLDLPQCLGCGVELQVSRDFTKVFCSSCGREWGRYEYEEIMGAPLNPTLAGKLPFLPDSSKTANELVELLDAKDVDYGTIYASAKLDLPDPNGPISFREALKQGWREGTGKAAPPSKQAVPNGFIALHEDYVAKYTFRGEELEIIESKFEDIFSEDQESVDFGYDLTLKSGKELNGFNDRLASFRVIHLANKVPFEKVLFGLAAQEAETSLSAPTTAVNSPEVSLSSELEKLGLLKAQGLITDAEFDAAKKKILGI